MLDPVGEAADVLQFQSTAPPAYDLGPAVGIPRRGEDFDLDRLPVELLPVVLVISQEFRRAAGQTEDELHLLALAAEMVLEASPAEGFAYWGVPSSPPVTDASDRAAA